MNKYHKIKTVFMLGKETKYKKVTNIYAAKEFEYLQNNQWIFTEKIDGMNIGVIFSRQIKGFSFAGRTDNADLPHPLVKKLKELFYPKVDLFAGFFNKDVCFYGEGYGPGIHGGGIYRDNQDFVLFDIRIGDWWLERDKIETIAKMFGIDTVPIIGTGTLSDMVKIVKSNHKSAWGNFPIEGIVATTEIGVRDRGGQRVITKLKCSNY